MGTRSPARPRAAWQRRPSGGPSPAGTKRRSTASRRTSARDGALAALCATEEGGGHPARHPHDARPRDGGGQAAHAHRPQDRGSPSATDAEVLLVVASVGLDPDGRSRAPASSRRALRRERGVRLEAGAPLPFAPELGHARAVFEDGASVDEQASPGRRLDATVLKPFRTIEDTHVMCCAVLGWGIGVAPAGHVGAPGSTRRSRSSSPCARSERSRRRSRRTHRAGGSPRGHHAPPRRRRMGPRRARRARGLGAGSPPARRRDDGARRAPRGGVAGPRRQRGSHEATSSFRSRWSSSRARRAARSLPTGPFRTPAPPRARPTS